MTELIDYDPDHTHSNNLQQHHATQVNTDTINCIVEMPGATTMVVLTEISANVLASDLPAYIYVTYASQ